MELPLMFGAGALFSAAILSIMDVYAKRQEKKEQMAMMEAFTEVKPHLMEIDRLGDELDELEEDIEKLKAEIKQHGFEAYKMNGKYEIRRYSDKRGRKK